MAVFEKEIDITKNIRMIEWLKSELITDIANLHKVLVNGVKEELNDSVADAVSNIILISFLLGRRLGINYDTIQSKIQEKIKLGLLEEHNVEKYYGDLSELSKHFNQFLRHT